MVFILDATDFASYPFNYEFQGNEAKRFIENVINFTETFIYNLLGVTLAKDYISQLTPLPSLQVSTLPHYITIHNDIKEFVKRRTFVKAYLTTYFYVGNIGGTNETNPNDKMLLERSLHNESVLIGCNIRKYIIDNKNLYPSFCECEWKDFADYNGLYSIYNNIYKCK